MYARGKDAFPSHDPNLLQAFPSHDPNPICVCAHAPQWSVSSPAKYPTGKDACPSQDPQLTPKKCCSAAARIRHNGTRLPPQTKIRAILTAPASTERCYSAPHNLHIPHYGAGLPLQHADIVLEPPVLPLLLEAPRDLLREIQRRAHRILPQGLPERVLGVGEGHVRPLPEVVCQHTVHPGPQRRHPVHIRRVLKCGVGKRGNKRASYE